MTRLQCCFDGVAVLVVVAAAVAVVVVAAVVVVVVVVGQRFGVAGVSGEHRCATQQARMQVSLYSNIAEPTVRTSMVL